MKFSVMKSGTLAHTHSGPTNCRLRAHLGLSRYISLGLLLQTVFDNFKENIDIEIVNKPQV